MIEVKHDVSVTFTVNGKNRAFAVSSGVCTVE